MGWAPCCELTSPSSAVVFGAAACVYGEGIVKGDQKHVQCTELQKSWEQPSQTSRRNMKACGLSPATSNACFMLRTGFGGWGISKRREVQGSWVTGAPGFVPMPQQMYLQKQEFIEHARSADILPFHMPIGPNLEPSASSCWLVFMCRAGVHVEGLHLLNRYNRAHLFTESLQSPTKTHNFRQVFYTHILFFPLK